MYRTILVPLDGSFLAERALSHAQFLAKTTRARIALLRVVEPRPFADSEEIQDEITVAEAAKAYLARVAEGLGDAVAVAPSVAVGPPAEEIARAVAAENAELIVMSTRGEGGLTRLVHGSVADAVIRAAPVPLLLLPPDCPPSWPERTPRRILVPLDGSGLAESALGASGDLAALLGAELVLLRVVALPHYVKVEQLPDPLPEAVPLDQKPEAEAYLAEVAARLPAAGRAVTTLVDSGDVVETILSDASAEETDVIALASHGRGGLTRLALGSVATGLIQRSSVPLLLVGLGARPEVASPAEDQSSASQR
jgi:nucleotide-binding universal stress UspA family protein